MALVALAGPIANLLIAFLALQLVGPLDSAGASSTLLDLLATDRQGRSLASINVVLAVFNMLPIPPLDGYRVLLGLLPGPAANSFASIEPYGPMILLLVVFMGQGLLGAILGAVGGPIFRILAVPIFGVLSG
jgi:Zn-dependent protease